jgi:hypothetical protein
MQNTDWVKKIGFWCSHVIVWILLNIILGSLPFFTTLLRDGKDDPFQVGLLCFCFTVVSSGLYIFLANSQKVEQSGFAKVVYMFLVAFSIVWVIGVWTVVLMLPDILSFIDNETKVKRGLYVLYAISILLFFGANRKFLSDLVNSHVSKYLIADSVSNSKVSGSVMKASLDEEGSF